MKIKSTKTAGVVDGVNVLLYGRAGIGKTCALAQCPKPIIVSAEGGLLSLQHTDTPYVDVADMKQLREVYKWLSSSNEADKYRTVCIDSLSEICDIAFIDCKRRVGNKPAELYPELRSSVLPLLTAFRSMKKNFIATARETTKQFKRDDITMPTVVGNKLAEDVAYVFDVVLHYTLDADDKRIVYTNNSCGSIAKDRTGLLPPIIKDTSNLLSFVIKKIIEV